MQISIYNHGDGRFSAWNPDAHPDQAQEGTSPDEAIGALVRSVYLAKDEVLVDDISTVDDPPAHSYVRWQLDKALPLAADRWADLRAQDVQRVIESALDEDERLPAGEIQRAIAIVRPDLEHEAAEVLADLEADMHATTRPE